MQVTQSNTAGDDMHGLIARLYPICRSITGNGVRESLRILGEQIPIEIREVPTGTQVFDWTVPREWNIRDGWIKNANGERIVDFQKLNLHVVSYSTPINRKMRLSELKDHLFTLRNHPDWVPYKTSYYAENWGFCLSQNQFNQLQDTEQYDVCIDSSLEDGHLTYGEYLLKGQQSDEVLISCHICHPSLANDNLSGIAVAVELARGLERVPRRYSYRFLFVPGTIGSITWLSQNHKIVKSIRHGFVLASVGDAADVTYKRSRRGDAEIDRAFVHVLKHSGDSHKVVDFFPYGYDERQYCSPGFNLPVGCMMRSPHGQCPEYHTSGDNLAFVRPEALADSLEKCHSVIDVLENNWVYINQQPKCEPQLGRRGLYTGLGSADERRRHEMALLWVLNFSDGQHDLLAIAERADVPFWEIKVAADVLSKTGLLKKAPPRRIKRTPANDQNDPADDMEPVGATYRGMSKGSYYLWFKPSGGAYDILMRTIHELATQLGGPVFEPHISLTSKLEGTEEELAQQTEEFARQLEPFKMVLTEPCYSDEHFRCIFMLVEQTTPMMNAYALAREFFHTPNQPFVPHLSLAYGSYPDSQKTLVMSKLPLHVRASFDVSTLYLIRADTPDPKNWHQIAAVPITSLDCIARAVKSDAHYGN